VFWSNITSTHSYLPQINDQDVIKLNKCRAKEYLLEFQYASTKTELYFNATGHMAISSSNEKTPFLNCMIWSVLTHVPSGNTNNGYMKQKTTCIQNIKKNSSDLNKHYIYIIINIFYEKTIHWVLGPLTGKSPFSFRACFCNLRKTAFLSFASPRLNHTQCKDCI
jgi:uncharacterized protein YbdZ (MbtH family)